MGGNIAASAITNECPVGEDFYVKYEDQPLPSSHSWFISTLSVMDLSDIPFDIPIILHSLHTGKNLKNPVGSKAARCMTESRDVYEQVVLRLVRDDKVAVESARNGRFLQVRISGVCVFDPVEAGERELFTMETDSDCSLFFVSTHTGNVLRCNDQGLVKCTGQSRNKGESWVIMEPRCSAPVYQAEPAPTASRLLNRSERQHVVLELAKYGKTPDEIKQIVTRLFDCDSK